MRTSAARPCLILMIFSTARAIFWRDMKKFEPLWPNDTNTYSLTSFRTPTRFKSKFFGCCAEMRGRSTTETR